MAADGGALRTLFAEIGFDLDDAALKAADQAVAKVASETRKLIGVTEKAEKADAKVADNRKKRAKDQVE